MIDAARNVVEQTVAAGGRGVAVDPSGAFAYLVGTVPDPDAFSRTAAIVSVLDTATNVVTAKVTLGPLGFGDDLLGIAVNQTTAYVVTTLDTEQFPCHISDLGCRLILNAIDTGTNAVSSGVLGDRPRSFPRAITFDHAGARLYLAYRDEPIRHWVRRHFGC